MTDAEATLRSAILFGIADCSDLPSLRNGVPEALVESIMRSVSEPGLRWVLTAYHDELTKKEATTDG